MLLQLEFIRIDQNPHFIYTISRINNVSILFEAIFNFGENDFYNLDSGLVEQVDDPAIKR